MGKIASKNSVIFPKGSFFMPIYVISAKNRRLHQRASRYMGTVPRCRSRASVMPSTAGRYRIIGASVVDVASASTNRLSLTPLKNPS